MSKFFHHDMIFFLSDNDLAHDRLGRELSNNDAEVIQLYSLSELKEHDGQNLPLTMIIYLDSLADQLYDLDLYREYAEEFSIIIINDLGSSCPFSELESIPFLNIIDLADEGQLYNINGFLDELYSAKQSA